MGKRQALSKGILRALVCIITFVWNVCLSDETLGTSQTTDVYGSSETSVLDNIELHLPRFDNPIEEERHEQ